MHTTYAIIHTYLTHSTSLETQTFLQLHNTNINTTLPYYHTHAHPHMHSKLSHTYCTPTGSTRMILPGAKNSTDFAKWLICESWLTCSQMWQTLSSNADDVTPLWPIPTALKDLPSIGRYVYAVWAYVRYASCMRVWCKVCAWCVWCGVWSMYCWMIIH